MPRASSMPLNLLCPPSLTQPKVRIERDSPEARLGSACHEGVRLMIEQTPFRGADLAIKYDVEYQELDKLLGMGWQCWNQIKRHFRPPLNLETAYEARLGNFILTGHVDLDTFADPQEIYFLDFKSGRREDNWLEQMRSYSHLLFSASPMHNSARCAVVRLREGVADWYRFTRAEIIEWADKAAERLQQTDMYNPGKQCPECPRSHECPAKAAHMQEVVGALMKPPDNIFDFQAALADPATAGPIVARLYAAEKLIGPALKEAERIRRETVQMHGGRLRINDEEELVVISQEQHPIEPQAAWPVLVDELGTDALLECVSITKGDVERKVKEKTPTQKGKAIAALWDKLDKAGGLATKFVGRMELRCIPKTLTETDHGSTDTTSATTGATSGADSGPGQTARTDS